MVITIFITISVLLISYFIIKKLYNECDNPLEKTFYWFIIAFEVIIFSLYYFDRYNVPTTLKWNTNVNAQNWLTILATSGMSLLVEIFGGIILIYITMLQIRKTNEDNMVRDKEERRINNLPLLVYSFVDCSDEYNNVYDLPTKYEEEVADLLLKIENIGMNAIRKCFIKINSSILENDLIFKLEEQSSIDNGESKVICFSFELPAGDYDLNFTIYYEDLIHNWYSQQMELKYHIDNVHNGIFRYTTKRFKVYDEKILKNQPKIIVNTEEYRRI